MVKDISVKGPIKLDQFLKWANIVSTGGHAKVLIQSGEVKVNEVVEMKRGRMLKNSDYVQVNDHTIYRVCIKDKEW